MAKEGVDLYIVYKFIRGLVTSFEDTEAFELGLIDEKGKLLKKPSTREEKKAYTYFDKLVFNIKRLLQKFNLDTRLGTFASALWLIREDKTFEDLEDLDDDMLNEIEAILRDLEDRDVSSFDELTEEIANVTGSSVVGTGDDPVHWKKRKSLKVGVKGNKRKMGEFINGTAFIRRTTREAIKKRKDAISKVH